MPLAALASHRGCAPSQHLAELACLLSSGKLSSGHGRLSGDPGMPTTISSGRISKPRPIALAKPRAMVGMPATMPLPVPAVAVPPDPDASPLGSDIPGHAPEPPEAGRVAHAMGTMPRMSQTEVTDMPVIPPTRASSADPLDMPEVEGDEPDEQLRAIRGEFQALAQSLLDMG